MSKSIAITLPNDVYDTLERKMAKLATKQVAGMRVNKSNYVTEAIKDKLLKDGEQVTATKVVQAPPVPTGRVLENTA